MADGVHSRDGEEVLLVRSNKAFTKDQLLVYRIKTFIE